MLEPKLCFFPRAPKRKLPYFDPNFSFAPSAAQFEDLRGFDVLLTDVWVFGGGVSAGGKRNQSPCPRCVCTWHIQHLHVEAELVGSNLFNFDYCVQWDQTCCEVQLGASS